MRLRDLVWLLTAFPGLSGFTSPRPVQRAWICCSLQGIWKTGFMQIFIQSCFAWLCCCWAHLYHAASGTVTSSIDLRRGQLISVITVGVSAWSHTALEMQVSSTRAASGVAVLCHRVCGDTQAEVKQVFETVWGHVSFSVKEESKYG